ncbi:MAG: hypothetical protein ACYTEL_26700 [Planctomycetota bacterium]|jgi:hypothetical protein
MKVVCFPLLTAALAVVIVLAVSGCIQVGDLTGRITSVDVDTGDSGDNQTIARKCPVSCSDGNPCTTDFCSGQTGFKCRNIPLTGKECGDNAVCNKGVCEEIRDNCSIILDIDTVSIAVREQEALDCYQSAYFDLAVEQGDTDICDEIVQPVFLGRCYAAVAVDLEHLGFCDNIADPSSRDACFFYFASSYADQYVFYEEACEMISDVGVKLECIKLEDKVTAPAGIKEFHAGIVGDEIHSYVVLKDMLGRTTVGEGSLTIYIKQEDVKGEEDRRLFSRTYDVKPEDFEITRLSGFGEQDMAYVIGPIRASDFEELPSENFGTFYITFYTPEGLAFFDSEELRF